MCMEAESVNTGRTGVGNGGDGADTDVWIGKEVFTGSVAETDGLSHAQAGRTDKNVVIASRLKVRR